MGGHVLTTCRRSSRHASTVVAGRSSRSFEIPPPSSVFAGCRRRRANSALPRSRENAQPIPPVPTDGDMRIRPWRTRGWRGGDGTCAGARGAGRHPKSRRGSGQSEGGRASAGAVEPELLDAGLEGGGLEAQEGGGGRPARGYASRSGPARPGSACARWRRGSAAAQPPRARRPLRRSAHNGAWLSDGIFGKIPAGIPIHATYRLPERNKELQKAGRVSPAGFDGLWKVEIKGILRVA
jgi:hypothetical protein